MLIPVGCWVEITEYHIVVYICTQKGQQITKLQFFMGF
jgi:hypothetical protein